MKSSIKKILIGTILAMTVAAVNASPLAYSNLGVENPVTYTFTAAASGDLIAYFAGSTAGYTNTLGLFVNGVDTGITGLNNHTSSYGQSLNFGHVILGDNLVFKLSVLTTGDAFFSDKSLNNDGIKHVYSNFYSGDSSIPAGTYVAFEDLIGGGDFNYHDENFVITNVAVSSVPIPAAVWLFSSGLAGLVSFKRRKTLY